MPLTRCEISPRDRVSKEYCPSRCECYLQNSVCLYEHAFSITCNKEIPRQPLLMQLDAAFYLQVELEEFMRIIVKLTISTANLKDLPSKICLLKSLRELYLYDLGLQTLTADCFSRMINLETLVVKKNNIASLPNDLFKGLENLVTIDFQHNLITDLQPELFQPIANAKRLTKITFAYNSLYSVDIWPLYFINLSNLEIILENNNISTFTNRLNSNISCSSAYDLETEFSYVNSDKNNLRSVFTSFPELAFYHLPRDNFVFENVTGDKNHLRKRRDIQNINASSNNERVMTLSLKGNKITQISSLIKGWGFSSIKFMQCFKMRVDLLLNPLHCDCSDYDVYMLLKIKEVIFHQVNLLFCSTPRSPYYMPLTALLQNMEKIFCFVTENCPEGCICENHPYSHNFLIICDKLPYTLLPSRLPVLPQEYNDAQYSYIINITQGNLQIFKTRSYLDQTSKLILSNNAMESIEVEAWKQLKLTSIIRLENNKLVALPSEVQQINLTLLKEIHLYGNPWSCDCNSYWMKQWLIALGSIAINREAILCHSNDMRNGSSMIHLNDDLFVCHRILTYEEQIAILVPSTIGACILLACIIMLSLYVKRHWFFANFKWHMFDIDECDGEDMDYDVFFSYANEDESDVVQLIENLEEKYLFKTCYHRRDFQPGVTSLVNIEMALIKSKRTVCYITENFLKSDWCLWEFVMALNLDLERKRHRLIVIKHASLYVNDVSSLSVRSYLFHYTYVEYPSRYALTSLLYWLPQRKILYHREGDENIELLTERI